MANPYYWLRRIRRNHQAANDAGDDSRFKRYETDYREILLSVYEECGEDAGDSLAVWMLETTRSNGQLPLPSAVKSQAMEICSAAGSSVPYDRYSL